VLALAGNANAAQAFTDKVYRTPSQKSIQLLAETATAANQVDTFIRSYNGRQIVLAIRASGTATGPAGVVRQEANGGVLDFYAAGGIRENHVAQIARAGTWRVWAEDETRGEAYIPLAASKRARSIEIWKQAGHRMGIESFAEGGVFAPRPVYQAAPQIYASTVAAVAAPQFEVVLAGKGGIDIRDYVDVTIREKDQRAAVRGRMGRR
jgi:hypothetical protein